MASPARRKPSPRLRHDPAAAVQGIDFKAITEASLDVILRCHMDGVATYVSPALKTLIGVEPKDLIGKCHRDYILPEDKPALQHTLEAHKAGQIDGRATFRMRHTNGSIVWIEGSGRVITDPDTGEKSFVIVLRDISDRKALEAQLSLLALTNGASPAAVAGGAQTDAHGAERPKERLRGSRSVN